MIPEWFAPHALVNAACLTTLWLLIPVAFALVGRARDPRSERTVARFTLLGAPAVALIGLTASSWAPPIIEWPSSSPSLLELASRANITESESPDSTPRLDVDVDELETRRLAAAATSAGLGEATPWSAPLSNDAPTFASS